MYTIFLAIAPYSPAGTKRRLGYQNPSEYHHAPFPSDERTPTEPSLLALRGAVNGTLTRRAWIVMRHGVHVDGAALPR
jgi:hypothetical protein